MSLSYDIYMLFPDGIAIKKAGPVLFDHFLKTSEDFHMGDMYYLNDLNEEEDRDVLDYDDAKPALHAIYSWPTYGWIDCYMYGIGTVIAFKSLKPSGPINAISISFSNGLFGSLEKNKQDTIFKWIKNIHAALKARRTVMGILDNFGFFWDQEIERLKNNIIEGSYRLDLRN